jgi:acyl dehydratase
MTSGFHSDGEVYVGRDMGGVDHHVTPELVAHYGAGTGDYHPWYSGSSPCGGQVAPALLFHSGVYRDLSWYLPNLIGNLHAKQEWELFHPMLVGDTVRTRSTVVERYRKRNRDYVVNEVVITDRSGRWLQRSRTHQGFLAEDSGGGFVVDKEREKRADRQFAVDSADGERLAGLDKTITLEMCQAFSGPHRNYHTDREMAQAMGFPDVVVQGMMSVCFISELMTRNFGVGWFYGGKLQVNLVNVVWPNDMLRVSGAVRERVPEGARARIYCDVWCEKRDGVKTIVGAASALRDRVAADR